MASNALEEKINKIRQQNEEIRRRYEEVEEDKKNAAKSNALVQMVPSSDWPERKEPPEFSNPPRNNYKVKPNKEHSEYSHQHYVGTGEGKRLHAFAQGEGPPPDPKYNFLADFEREEHITDEVRDNGTGRGRGRNSRGNFKKKGPGREGYHKDQRIHHGAYRDDCPPEYDAWRAERNRIDEDRISRQRTAEGNWRREWDNDKVHIVDDVTKRESRSNLGNFIKRDQKEFDRRYHTDNNDHLNKNRGNIHRSHQGSGRNHHSGHDHRYNNSYDYGYASPKIPLSSPGTDERAVLATDKSLKVTLNQGNVPKGALTSVKVYSPSIAGTGRVGPRQRTRISYSGHSDMEANLQNNAGFLRQRSFEDKSKNVHSNNAQNSHNLRRSYSQRKKDYDMKSPCVQKKEFKDGNSQNVSVPKSPKASRKNVKTSKSDSASPMPQSNNESKELDADIDINVEQLQKGTSEITNNTVPCESDMCVDSVQKVTDVEMSGIQDVNCVQGVAQSTSDTQNLKLNEDTHYNINNSDTVSNTENNECVFTEAVNDDSNIKSKIDNLNESLNSSVQHVVPLNSIVIPDSFEKSATNEQYRSDNLTSTESKEVTSNRDGDNISQEEIVELCPDKSSEDSKEQVNENIEADAEKLDGAKQLLVVEVVDDSCNCSLTNEADCMIAVDNQRNNVSLSDETLPVENLSHSVDVIVQETAEIMNSKVLQTKHAQKVEEQDMTEIDSQMQFDNKVANEQKSAAVQDKEEDVHTDTKKNVEVVSETHLDSTVVTDDKTSFSLAAEMSESVIETNTQLDCDYDPIEIQKVQEAQEKQETTLETVDTDMHIKEIQDAIIDKPLHAVTVESESNNALSSSVETNSVIEANNQMNENGDSSKLEDSKTESVLLECQEDSVMYLSNDKCLETIETPNENLTDKDVSDNEENGAISVNVESQTKSSDITDEIDDNKVKATEFVVECSKE